MGVGRGIGLLAWGRILPEQRALFPEATRAYSSGMPKVKPTVSRTKKPMPMIEPIPVIAPAPAAVIPPLRPGGMAKNLTGKLSRPNPVVRRGRK
jgi:hypothetical protein